MSISFELNGHPVTANDPTQLFIDWVRHHQHLTGTKAACREGDCGSCQILVRLPGKIVGFRSQPSCLLRLADLQGSQVLTIEGIVSCAEPLQHPLVPLLTDAIAGQCGFCSPGLVVAALNWLLHGPTLDFAEGEAWLNGNLCRCTGYMGQRRAIQSMLQHWRQPLLETADRTQLLVDRQLLPDYALRPLPTPSLSSQYSVAEEPIIGGGTDLYLQHSTPLCGTSQLAIGTQLPGLLSNDDSYRLNARWPIQALADHPKVQKHLPFFAPFCHWFASLPVRNKATLGGNLAHASPVGDAIALFMALDAIIETNQRSIPIQHFYTGFKQSILTQGEVIEWLRIDKQCGSSTVLFEKVCRRQTTDIAAVNCALYFNPLDKLPVRLVVGGCTPIPVRLTQIEQCIAARHQGSAMSTQQPQWSAQFAPLITEALQPISDVRGSAEYRQTLAQQLVKAVLAALHTPPSHTTARPHARQDQEAP